MWACMFHIWSAVVWMVLLTCHHPVSGHLWYIATELLRLRCHLPEPPPHPELHHHLNVALLPWKRYIYHGCCRDFQCSTSNAVRSLWSTSHRCPRNSSWAVDKQALAILARLANVLTKHDNTVVNFGLLNISWARDISSRISSLTVSLTFSVLQKPGNSPMTFHS